MNYIGISSGFHDAAVSIVNDKGDILFAGHSERYSKNKHDKDHLICVGDYIDRGLFPGETIQLLSYYFDEGNTTLLIGNHDFYGSSLLSVG